ncbi:MAG: hypothetical protein C4292_04610 [Nitrososphaera sp.]
MPTATVGFVLDLQSSSGDIDADLKVASAILCEYQKRLLPDGGQSSFALEKNGPAVAGWSFARLSLSARFVQSLYDNNSYEIERAKGRSLTEKFIAWLGDVLKKHGCPHVVLKAGEEMYDRGYHGGLGEWFSR